MSFEHFRRRLNSFRNISSQVRNCRHMDDTASDCPGRAGREAPKLNTILARIRQVEGIARPDRRPSRNDHKCSLCVILYFEICAYLQQFVNRRLRVRLPPSAFSFLLAPSGKLADAAAYFLLFAQARQPLFRFPLSQPTHRDQPRKLLPTRPRFPRLPVVHRQPGHARQDPIVLCRQPQTRPMRAQAIRAEARICRWLARDIQSGRPSADRSFFHSAQAPVNALTARFSAAISRRYCEPAFFVAVVCARTSRRANRRM